MQEKKTEKTSRRKNLIAFLAGALVMFAGMQIYTIGRDITSKESIIHALIGKYYLHEIDADALEDGKYKGMLEALDDPYTSYLTVEETNDRIMQNEGTYRGIGIVLSQNAETGELTVTRCYPGSPAEEAGIQEGDILYQVDELLVAEMELSEVTGYIKNCDEDGVELTLVRKDMSDAVKVQVIPTTIQSEMVKSEMLEDKIGYLILYDFTETTYEQFQEHLNALKEQGMTRLIVDLRSNTGGLLTSVTDILDSILPEGIMVYTMDKEGNRHDYTSSGASPLQIPMVVLVNGYTASASEIFAGAVRDYGMAQLVGTKTYGKGVVQSTFYLEDGSAVKLTSANYYTPKGTNIDGSGLEPDVTVELELDTEDAVGDNQLEKAIEVIKTMK